MSASERRRELRRRRHRRKKVQILKRKATRASASEKAHLADKLRRLSPGAVQLIANLGLGESS